MEGGLLQQLGTPERVYNEPANIFVAGFIGSPPLNFLEWELVEEDSNIHLESQGISLELPSIMLEFFSSSSYRNVTIGIRPKDVVFLDNAIFDGFKVMGEVSFTELLGDEIIVDVSVGSDSVKVTNTNPNLDLNIGKKVTFGLHYDKVQLFDTKTGKRLVLNEVN